MDRTILNTQTTVIGPIDNSKTIDYNYHQDKNNFITPKKAILNALISSDIKQLQQQRSPANRGDLQAINLNFSTEPLHILKDRYLLANYETTSVSNLKCTDIYTEINYGCKLINENYEKVALAYFQLKQNNPNYDDFGNGNGNGNSDDNQLVRPIHDAVQVAKNRTYLVIPTSPYGDLHSYIKLKRRLSETMARHLFRQICDTVQLCHQNGIVLRDLKLKKFFFTSCDRTQLQYESLEGSFILDNSADDTLSEKIGCPLYVAPELITPNTTFGGFAADMWSLGIILYTILVGRYPFSDTNGQNLLNKILHGDVNMPSYVSAKAKCLIRSLLQRNPAERLTCDDVAYHPWFTHPDSDLAAMSSANNSTDQFVPDLSGDDDVEDQLCMAG